MWRTNKASSEIAKMVCDGVSAWVITLREINDVLERGKHVRKGKEVSKFLVEFSSTRLRKFFIVIANRKEKVPFSMAIKNAEL